MSEAVGALDSCGQQEMTREQMRERISLLAAEIDANLEENRAMQEEIDSLYEKIDEIEISARAELVAQCHVMIEAGNPVGAVKKFRAATGASLKAARAALRVMDESADA